MSDEVVLRGVRVVTPGEHAGPATDVVLRGGWVAAVGGSHHAAGRRVELDGLWLAPGLIDLQVNGAAGHDITADPTSIWAVGEALVRTGVTAWMPTIVTAPPGTVERAAAVLAGGPPSSYRGATPLGIHVEGPFLSPERHGAHDPALLRVPDRRLVQGWSPDAGVRIVTLAPELPGALDLIGLLVARGVVVSLGHSAATLEQGRAGIAAGATYATHLFNAMPGLGHREPGLAAAVLADTRVTVGTIPDAIHVHPAMLDLAWRIAGPDRFSVVTDAMAAMGMADGTFVLGDMAVTVDHTGPRLEDGRLAGSVLTMDAALRNLAAATDRGLETALAAATTVPARLLDLPHRGRVEPGAVANLTIFTPDGTVVGTIAGGRLVYASDALGVDGAWD